MPTTIGKFPGIRYSPVPVKRSGFLSGLFGSERDRDRAETIELYKHVLAAYRATPFADEHAVSEVGKPFQERVNLLANQD